MMLVKSNDLSKSVLDMNTHYLELQISLGELAQHPEQALNPHYKVFPSEEGSTQVKKDEPQKT